MLFHRESREERFGKLARRVEEVRRNDEADARRRSEIAEKRVQALLMLWEICRNFADHLNRHIEQEQVILAPPDPPADINEDNSAQLLLSLHGRVLLLDIRIPSDLVSSDNFRKPYILEGEVRFFNQKLLDEERVEEHAVFFCHEEGPGGAWLYWNSRSYTSGRLDEDYLAGLLEQIL